MDMERCNTNKMKSIKDFEKMTLSVGKANTISEIAICSSALGEMEKRTVTAKYSLIMGTSLKDFESRIWQAGQAL